MSKFKYLMLVLGLFVMLGSCVKPVDPTEVQILTGEWEVENVIANGESNLGQVFQNESRLHLDRNESFLFVNVDGYANSGTWAADETSLTLGDVVYTIVYLDYDKLHVYTTFNNALTGDVELRYLFKRVE